MRSRTCIDGAFAVGLKRLAFTLAAPALFLAASAGDALAETKAYNSSGQVVESAWTTCPSNPVIPTVCNYTSVYAARGSNFSRFLILSLANFRIYPGGSAELLAYGYGYTQPATSVTVATSTLATGAASGGVLLYGNCGDPSNFNTCYYMGSARISSQFAAIETASTWDESKSFTAPNGIRSQMRMTGASRAARTTASASFEGNPWALGSRIGARIFRFTVNQTLTCPSVCPTIQRAIAPNASLVGKLPPANEEYPGERPQLKDAGEASFSAVAPQDIFSGFGGNLGGFDFQGQYYAYSPLPIDPRLVNYFFNIFSQPIAMMAPMAPTSTAILGGYMGIVDFAKQLSGLY